MRYAVLFVRMTFTGDGHLLHGEVLDLNGTLCGRFRSVRQLARALQECAAASWHEQPTDPPAT